MKHTGCDKQDAHCSQTVGAILSKHTYDLVIHVMDFS